MEKLPIYISIVFVLTTFLAVGLFYNATNKSKTTVGFLAVWIILQAIVALSGFYTKTDTVPPRFALLVLPPLICIVLLFIMPNGRIYIDRFDISKLTILHIVRIPIELVLLWLCMNKAVPQLMTFEGRNFDVFSGLTAPFIYYFGFIRKKLNRNVLLIWSFACILLLLNIVINAILSAPFPFQKFAFDQPNIAILYFPFVWLPCCIVPLVLFSHLATIRKLVRS